MDSSTSRCDFSPLREQLMQHSLFRISGSHPQKPKFLIIVHTFTKMLPSFPPHEKPLQYSNSAILSEQRTVCMPPEYLLQFMPERAKVPWVPEKSQENSRLYYQRPQSSPHPRKLTGRLKTRPRPLPMCVTSLWHSHGAAITDSWLSKETSISWEPGKATPCSWCTAMKSSGQLLRQWQDFRN